MDNSVMILLVPVIIIVMILLVVYGQIAERKRREALSLLATRLGWRFDTSGVRGFMSQFAHFGIFSKGHSRRPLYTLTGSMQVNQKTFQCVAGDFLYKVTSGSGKHRRTQTYHFSYLIVCLPWNGVPDLMVRREHLFDKIGSVFGFDDIDFESAEFSKTFCVKSTDKRFTYALIDPRMMEFLMQAKHPMIDIEQQQLCLSDGSSRWDVEEFEEHLNWAMSFFDHWPRHLTDELEQS